MPERVIFRHRRAIAAGRAGARAGRGGVRAAGVRRARQRERLRRPVGRGGRRPQRGQPTRRGRSRRRAWSRWCGWARTPTARAAQERIARGGAARCATRAWRRWSPTQPGGDRAARLRATAARPTCWRRSRTTRRGARPTRSRQRLARRYPWVTLGGGAIAAPAVGDQVSADIARAELIAFPILFLLTLLVFRSAVSALLPLAVGGDDDPAQLPRDPGRQHARSTRCRSTP